LFTTIVNTIKIINVMFGSFEYKVKISEDLAREPISIDIIKVPWLNFLKINIFIFKFKFYIH